MRTMTMRNKIITHVLFLLFSALLFSQGKVSGLEAYLQSKGLVNVSELDASIRSDLKYASADNFTKTILYDTLSGIYLHPVAAAKLLKAQKYLKEINPNLSLLVYDAARPLSVQKKMYEAVRNTRYAAYVANPAKTGLHNYGMAVDLTICDSAGKPLDMGTPFDFFGSAAGINKEEELVQRGILTNRQVNNRKLLRKVMTQAGFSTIRGEWWHFNAVSLSEAKRSYEAI
jgi:D-alanyl-D-alanine dipeptidase